MGARGYLLTPVLIHHRRAASQSAQRRWWISTSGLKARGRTVASERGYVPGALSAGLSNAARATEGPCAPPT